VALPGRWGSAEGNRELSSGPIMVV